MCCDVRTTCRSRARQLARRACRALYAPAAPASNGLLILQCNKRQASRRKFDGTSRQTMNTLHRSLTIAATSLMVAACATQVSPTAPSAGATGATPIPNPGVGFFSKIKAPSTHQPTLQLASRGVQIFRCEKRDTRLTWVFRQPQADLLDATGKVVGKHGANFSFEHDDGSRLVSTIAAFDEASKPTDLRWVLFTTRSFGQGVFENVTHVQRVNTSGGMPPTRCEPPQLNQLLRVDFTSDFVFYRPRPE